jgi:hypothetical protein
MQIDETSKVGKAPASRSFRRDQVLEIQKGFSG